jgi:hypothetical protein
MMYCRVNERQQVYQILSEVSHWKKQIKIITNYVESLVDTSSDKVRMTYPEGKGRGEGRGRTKHFPCRNKPLCILHPDSLL